MALYEERLEQDLEAIRAKVRDLAERVDVALAHATKALVTGDRGLASETILGDLVINRRVRKLDGRCHGFVARHLPSAGHLRFVSAVMRLSIALERIGDYAVVIARELGQLDNEPSDKLKADFEAVSLQTRTMLSQAALAFDEGNADLATGTAAMSHPVDLGLRRLLVDLKSAGEKGKHSVNDLLALSGAINRLSRVADQAENMCEETIFVATGKMVKKRLTSVLFVAKQDDALTQLAVAYSRKAFSDENRFESAGWNKSEGVEPRTRLFLEDRGLDLQGLSSRTADELGAEIREFDVLVSLDGGVEHHVSEHLPFGMVVLEWDLGVAPNDLDQDRAEAALGQAFDTLRSEMGRLMDMLRGREVD